MEEGFLGYKDEEKVFLVGSTGWISSGEWSDGLEKFGVKDAVE